MSRGEGESGATHSDLSGNTGDVVQARDVTGGIHFHGPGRDPLPVPAQLPADVRGFVNRTADLDHLDAVLGPDVEQPDSAAVCVIAGTAGVGKTSLAVRWAYRNRHRFPDGQLHVNLRGYDPGEPVTAAQALERFLTALGVVPGAVPPETEARSALFRSLLADRRMLVVLDNAATVRQVRPLLPGAGRCLALVTSRSRLSGLITRDGARRITLEVFDEPEAVELLRATTSGYRSGDADAEFAELARLCARLPLALRIAAERAAARPRMPMGDLIDNLRDESHLWDALSAEDDDEADAVRTVFAWSYRALPAEAARMFRLLGLHPGSDFSVHAAVALAAVPEIEARRQLDALVGAHLLGQISRDRFQFHDLLRAYAIDQVRHEDTEENRANAVRRVDEWYLHTANACVSALPSSDQSIRQFSFDAPGPHTPLQVFKSADEAAAWFEIERFNLIAAVRSANRRGDDHMAWQIPIALCRAYVQTDLFDDWFVVTEIGLNAVRREGDSRGEAFLLESLAMACRQSYRPDDAVRHAAAATDIYRRIEDEYGVAFNLTIAALAHIEAHRVRLAHDLLAEAERLCREGSYQPLLISVLSDRGWAFETGGSFQNAYELQRQALDLIPGPDTLLELKSAVLHALAGAARGLRRYDEAKDWIDQALVIARAANHVSREAFHLVECGTIQLAQGDTAGALNSFQRSASMLRRLGSRSREARALDGTGSTYAAMGRWEEAASFHRQAVHINRNLGDSWRAAVALNHLAAAVREVDSSNSALPLWREALALLDGFDDLAARELRASIGLALTAD